MDQLLPADNLEAVDGFGQTFNSLLNSSESNFFDELPKVDGIDCDCKNEKIESTKESSDRLVDTDNHSLVSENDVSSISLVENEVIKNDDNPVAESNSNAGKDFEKVTDNESKKENVCGSRNGDSSLVNDEILDNDLQNNFVPTIVEIRGGCSDVLEQADQCSSTPLHHDVGSLAPLEVPNLNIDDVLGGCKNLKADNEIKPMSKVILRDNTCIRDITMKEGPPNNVVDNDCIHTEAENCKTSSSNELLNIEEKSVNTEAGDPVVISNETTSKLHSPIPIKVESSLETPNSSQTEKCVAKKRFTRSSLSKSNDSVALSSSSNVNKVSNSKKRNQLPKNTPYSSGGYSCHLCNTVFQEHELLNEHMVLHRNNNLVEESTESRSKMAKLKPYTCDICKRELSSSQSLQQHVLIHKNVKPFGCHICQKDFRHLSNYRMHLQKHKAEQLHRDKMQQADKQEQLDKNVVRSADFGRLVGPLFMKESLMHHELDTTSNKSKRLRSATSSSTDVTRKTTFTPVNSTYKAYCQPLLFDQPPFKIKENTISSISSPVIIKRQVPSPDSISEEECMAVKSFKNIESVVMDASKFIVKLDNLDTSVLKRKLLTPNISIDQPPKKCRVQLSPIAEKYNLKLDDIENIFMDVDVGEIDLPSNQKLEDNQCYDYVNEENGVEPTCDSVYPPTGTLSDNELFTLLNDDKETSTTIVVDVVGDSSSNCQILHPSCNQEAKTAISPAIKQNVVLGEKPLPYDISCHEDMTAVDDELDDAFDTAFQKVATRRLALLRKRAAENNGNIESRYSLGPLFWCKALRRAVAAGGDSSSSANADVSNGSHIGDAPKMWPGFRRFGGRSRYDDRRTNDPIKLQSRAERKFRCFLERAKMVTNRNTLNLAGPLFWRRTLRLAGVHCGEDLRIHMNVTLPSLEGVKFVTDDETPSASGEELVNAELQKTPQSSVPVCYTPTSKSNRQQSNDQLSCDELSPSIVSSIRADDVLKLPDQILASVSPVEQRNPISDNAAVKNTLNDIDSLETNSILFERPTEPKENQQQPVEPDNSTSSEEHCGSVFIANSDDAMISLSNDSRTELPENCSTEMLNHKDNELTGEVALAEEDHSWPIGKLSIEDSSSIVLNEDGDKSSQLITANNDQVIIPETGQNFVLVSDASGSMQYLVNVSNENYSNFELIGDTGCGEQIAFALQFDGENYPAVQFVQDEHGFQLQSDELKEGFLVDSKQAAYLVSNAGAAATAVISDPNHIGKELSDFLNLDSGNLLKNGTADQPLS